MSDLIVVERVVRCPFSVAHDYAEDFLRDASGRVFEARVPLRDFIWALRGRFHRPVKLVFRRHLDATESGRQHDAMLIDWSAGTALCPDFHGHLRMRIASVETTRLTFEGSYEPPFGPPGPAIVLSWTLKFSNRPGCPSGRSCWTPPAPARGSRSCSASACTCSLPASGPPRGYTG